MTEHPRLPGMLLGSEVLGDTDEQWTVAGSDLVYDSSFVGLSVDSIVSPDGETLRRTVLHHKGAVGVLVLDEDDRVLVLDQYRHPVGRRLIELPAGILDVDGEAPVEAARRELREEADLEASEWRPLLRMYATPGCSTEHWEVFLAEGLSPTPRDERIEREGEEADMRQLWVPLEALISAALDGRISDSMTVASVLAVSALRSRA